jgi:N utilization substance protein B
MALDAVFAADLRKINPELLLAASAEEQLDRQNQEDDRIEAFSHKWSVERMPAVDRAILRVACWEILFNEEVPDGVAISEAVQLAAELSTEDSSTFVNGLLGAIAGTKTAR